MKCDRMIVNMMDLKGSEYRLLRYSPDTFLKELKGTIKTFILNNLFSTGIRTKYSLNSRQNMCFFVGALV
jgi:hypothetical protein